MELGAPDEKGRRKPEGTGKFEEIAVDSVIAAIGQTIDWGALDTGAMEKGKKSAAVVDGIAYQTAEADIFAGGDCVTGPRFAIDAIAAGKQGAISISRLLRGRNLTDGRNASFEAIDTDDVSVRVSRIDATPRQTAPEVCARG